MKYYFVLLIFLIHSFTKHKYQIDESQFIVHEVDISKGNLKMYWKNDKDEIYGLFKNLKADLETKGKTLLFAMNGGMYQKDQSPQGLYIENGIEKHSINKVKDAYGNFYLQPNGIFYWSKAGKAQIIKTIDFKSNSEIQFATQSGPMLLIDGNYHPALKQGSTNVHIRNGVGILPNGNALFAISKEKVNFYDLATLFKQKGCKNALYLDGFVSKCYLPSKNSNDLGGNFGVILAETKQP